MRYIILSKDVLTHTIFFCFLMCDILQVYFSSNAAALASRKSSPRVTNEAVQKAVSAHHSFIYVISVSDKF